MFTHGSPPLVGWPLVSIVDELIGAQDVCAASHVTVVISVSRDMRLCWALGKSVPAAQYLPHLNLRVADAPASR